MNKRTSLLLVLLLVLSLGLVACGGSGDSGGGSASNSPEDAIRSFMEGFAALDVDAMVAAVCDDVAEAGREAMAGLEQSLGGQDVEIAIDVSSLTYTVNSQDGNTAEVSISGQMVISAMGQDLPLDAAEMFGGESVTVVNDGGTWKMCEAPSAG